MEENKEVCAGKENCTHLCVDLHRFCGRHYCITRVVVAAVVIIGVFAAGCAMGRHEERERFGYERYGGYRMMMGTANAGYTDAYGCPMLGQYQENTASDLGFFE